MTPESAPDELYSVLEAFRPFLKSIDMRTIAVRSPSDEEWENLVTSLIVSEKTVDEVKSVHDQLPKIRNNEVALFLVALPFDYSVFDGFCKGDIGHGMFVVAKVGLAHERLKIRTRQFDPLKLKVTSTSRRIEGSLKWVLTAANSNSAPEREGLWAVIQNQGILLKQLDYENTEALIKYILRMEDARHNKDFELTISDLAQINNVTFNKSTFDVEISKISGLRNLQLNVIQSRAENYGSYYPVWRKSIQIDERAEPSREQIYVVKESIQPPDLLPFDHVTLKLIYRDAGLTLDETYQRAPLQNVVEPFLEVLNAFCPLDKFREMLLKPEDFENAPEKMFENAVSWLLSLAGFHTIYLGANTKATKTSFDVLRKHDKYQIGSADIIAYEDNERLLLVDCDIGGLSEQKIQKLVETRDYFESLCSYKELKIVPVLFSPKTFGEAAKNKPVAIVDGSIIENMLEEIAKGNRESARSKIWL